MTQGFSGGFFLPAQHSVHCQGGFFSSATRATAPGAHGTGGGGTNATAATRATAPCPVLFTLPHVPQPRADHTPDAAPTTSSAKTRGRRVYDPEEGDEECAVDDANGQDDHRRRVEPDVSGPLHQGASAATYVVRGRQQQQQHGHQQQQQQQHRREEGVEARAPRSRGKNASREVFRTQARPREKRYQPQEQDDARPEKGDINSKFEMAMKELNRIKDEFELKNQRQHSAPMLPAARTTPLTAKTPQRKTTAPAPSMITTASPNQGAEPQDTATSGETLARDMQSPRQRLQIAEMVMRKLYKKNLLTEQELAAVKAEKELLAKRLAALEAGVGVDNTSTRPTAPETTAATSSSGSATPCRRCTMNNAVGFVLANPPSLETVSRIDQQQLEYLRHLAAEQDRTITSLKLRVEDLSTQVVTSTKPHAASGKSTSGAKGKNSTPRQAVTKLQSKLQEALSESERQKSNYLKLKRDFQHLLTLKTKTLYENPAQLHASARELVALMDKQLKQLEVEHSANLSLYNSKLYESEQQSCESYAQQRLLEEEMDRVARDVQQRDALDVEIEQCMANVFERLHHVESENVHLKQAIISTHGAT